MVADQLHSAAIRLLRRLRRVDDRSGLSGPRLSALSVLVIAGEMSLGQLAAAEQVKPPSMTRLVAGLGAEGLVERSPDPLDARVVRVRATPAGRAMLQKGRDSRIALLKAQIAKLPVADQNRLARASDLMHALAEGIDVQGGGA